jgi:hypothetical protein
LTVDSNSSYQSAAESYAQGVRDLFAAAPGAPTTRGELAPAPPTDLADRAEALAATSRDLTTAAAAKLAHPDPNVRIEGSTQLLAKALADLQVSAVLFQAAQAEQGSLEGTRDLVPTVEMPGDLEDTLGVLTGSTPVVAESATRGREAESGTRGLEAAPDPAATRNELTNVAGNELTTVRTRAAQTGQAALQGLVGLGLTQVASAAGIVGGDIAKAIGVGEQVGKLFSLFRDFVVNGYNALLALLGPALGQMAAGQVLTWAKEVESGAKFDELLEKLYGTEATRQALTTLIAGSTADVTRLTTAITGITALDASYKKQMELVDKVRNGLKLVGMAAGVALPQGRVLLAALYLIVGGYVVLAGADYVDAPNLKLLNRVPGVRQIVEQNLGPAAAAPAAGPATAATAAPVPAASTAPAAETADMPATDSVSASRPAPAPLSGTGAVPTAAPPPRQPAPGAEAAPAPATGEATPSASAPASASSPTPLAAGPANPAPATNTPVVSVAPAPDEGAVAGAVAGALASANPTMVGTTAPDGEPAADAGTGAGPAPASNAGTTQDSGAGSGTPSA